MKAKFKPVGKAEIRERVEHKFRARGSLHFHLLLVLGALLFLLYSAFDFWVLWGELQGFSTAFDRYRDSVNALCVLSTTAALHVIHYYFRHGRGRERHEAETDRRIDEQLRYTSGDDLEEQEMLVRTQMADKLKNRRLVFWHLALYLGVMTSFVLLHPLNARALFRPDPDIWHGPLTLAGIWGIGLGAHLLRYVFAHGGRWEKRQAKLDQLVERELRRERRKRADAETSHADKDGGISLAEIESVSRPVGAQSERAR
ncbi:MAG: hypothetical protein OXG49_18570 [Chloroflexi bacterium]|nr:hypothetical protein [Chloroflexota bacterium]